MAKTYYESGELNSMGNFVNGMREGISKSYYKSGKYRYIDTFKNGHRINRKTYDEIRKLVKE